MKWKVDSITPSIDGVTGIVRIEITKDDGTVLYDQNSIRLDADKGMVRDLCTEMAKKHEAVEVPDYSHLLKMES